MVCVLNSTRSVMTSELSDLWQGHTQTVSCALKGQGEGVFVGVMLDDVVVHVHQHSEGDQEQHQSHVMSL